MKNNKLPICNITGQSMTYGFYFEDSNFYCISEKHATEHAKSLGYKNLNESYNAKAHYWTSWEDEV